MTDDRTDDGSAVAGVAPEIPSWPQFQGRWKGAGDCDGSCEGICDRNTLLRLIMKSHTHLGQWPGKVSEHPMIIGLVCYFLLGCGSFMFS